MLIEVYLCSDSYNEKIIPNGVNLKISRALGENNVTFKIVDDGDLSLLPFSFEIDYTELKEAILKL